MPGTEQEVRINGHSSPSSVAFQAKQNGMTKKLPSDSVINLDHGDPKMIEPYWQKMGDKCIVVNSVWQSLSYFSDITNLCWFLEPELAEEIRRLHHLVANTEPEGRYIVVVPVQHNSFRQRSMLYHLPIQQSRSTSFQPFHTIRWAGDAYTYKGDQPYIELVPSPNNPDGFIRETVVNRSRGKHWPCCSPSPKALAMLGHHLQKHWSCYVTGRSHAGSRSSFMTSCYSQGRV